MLRTIFTVVPP